MEKSTSKVEVVPIELKPHPDAQSLSIVEVFGYTCVVRTEDWKDRKIGAYIPPDSVCPDTPMFAFLGDARKRVKTVRLRGILSMGLLVPAPEGSKIGDNVADILGITHWEPPVEFAGDQEASPPRGIFTPTYDVDTIRRFKHLFVEGEPVYVSEKIHGENFRLVFHSGELHLGSRTRWKKNIPGSDWWKVVTPEMEQFCRENEGSILYGEAYGKVKGFKYGNKGPRFVAFDVLKKTEWLDAQEFCDTMSAYGIPRVPILGWEMPFNMEKIEELAEGESLLAKAWGETHVREGCVVKPMKERISPEIGRVMLKLVGNGYYEAGGGGNRPRRKEQTKVSCQN